MEKTLYTKLRQYKRTLKLWFVDVWRTVLTSSLDYMYLVCTQSPPVLLGDSFLRDPFVDRIVAKLFHNLHFLMHCLHSAVPTRYQHDVTVIRCPLTSFLDHLVCTPITEEYLTLVQLHRLAILRIRKNSSCFQTQGEAFKKDPHCKLLSSDLWICDASRLPKTTNRCKQSVCRSLKINLG